MYNFGKKRGKAENDGFKQTFSQIENYKYYFKSLTNKKMIIASDINEQECDSSLRENTKDESSSTKSSPTFAEYTKLGTSTEILFKLDNNDFIERSKSSALGSNLSQKNGLSGLSSPKFEPQCDESNPNSKRSPILNPTSLVPFNQDLLISEANCDNGDKIFLSYQYDSKSDSNSGFMKEYSEKFVKEKIKLGDNQDIESVSGSFQTGIREKDGKIEKVERTEVITILNITKDVEDKLKLLKDATENPQTIVTETHDISPIFKKLVSKKIIDISKVENDEKRLIENKEIIRLNQVGIIIDEKIEVKSKEEIGKVFDFDKINQDSNKQNTIIKINNDQLFQHLREKLDIPDETGKFNRMFTDNLLIGEGSYGKVFKVNLIDPF